MSRRRGWLAGAAVVGALLLILFLSDPAEDRYDRPPLDPRGTGPQGTAALVDLLRSEGAGVRLGGLAAEGDDVVIQLRDTLAERPNRDLERWARNGGTLVVTDPSAALASETVSGEPAVVDQPGPDCQLRALAELEPLDPGLEASLAAAPGESVCYSGATATARGSGVVVRRVGLGLVVSVSSPLPLTNGALGRGDNAVLAVALVAPGDATRVRILDPNRFYSDTDEVGDGTVLGALPPRGSEAVSQLLVAFLVWAVVSGRRLGKPVAEELPVPLPASDLVLASGRLLDRNGDTADAAERLRRQARRELGIAVGLGADPAPDHLAHALSTRAGIDPGLVHHALIAPVGDEATLVATAAHLDNLRRDLHQ